MIYTQMKEKDITITLYGYSPCVPTDNFIIDDLEGWLLSNGDLIKTITSRQPFELNMKQLIIDEVDTNAFIVTPTISYCRVAWAEYYAYYWVRKVTRGADKRLILEIELDVLNTLHNGDKAEGSLIDTFSSRSVIERQHEDRFYTGHTIVGSSPTPAPVDLIPKVDRVLENSQLTLRRLPNSDLEFTPRTTSAEVNEIDSLRWFLVYATDSDTKKLACYLVPNGSIDFFDTSYNMWHACKFNKIIRTSSSISKIIALPFCPIEFRKETHGSNTAYVFAYTRATEDNAVFSTISGYKAINIDVELIADTEGKPMPLLRTLNKLDYNNMLVPERWREVFYKPHDTLLQDERFILDSKLNSSEFKGVYIVYDSFVVQLSEENFNHDSPFSFNIEYAQSPDVDSDFVLRVVPNLDYLSEEYYPLIMSSNRKNEVAVYSSDYLNYIRNGYNYDKTKKDITNVISVLSSGAGFVGSLATGNVLGAVGTGMSLAKSITGVVTSELSMEQKLKELGSKAISVSGVNDSSLFYYYGNNKPKIVLQKPVEEEIERWNDTFHYYGYNRSGRLGVPNVTSRTWFNYLKGEIIFKKRDYIPLWLLESVTDKFRDGVTYLHANYINGVETWDIRQTRENYEKFLLGD